MHMCLISYQVFEKQPIFFWVPRPKIFKLQFIISMKSQYFLVLKFDVIMYSNIYISICN